MAIDDRPYWQRKALNKMSHPEWEALCDGCGQCCRHKLEDAETGEIYPTRVACQLLDTHSCRCSDYANRHASVPDCITLTVDRVSAYTWLPVTCAYRRLAEGKDLAWWHPLVSGDPQTVHTAGISVRDQLVSERNLPANAELEDYMEAREWN